jgi:hypothetical protein
MFGGSTSLTDSPTTANRKTWLFKLVQGQYNWVWCNCDNSINKLISPGLAYDNYQPPNGPSSTDPTAGEVIEFGGDSGGTKSSSTYAFNGTTWGLLSPTLPIPLSSPGMAFHSQLNEIILFGGGCNIGDTDCDTGYYGQTWAWDGANWNKLSVGSPGARSGHRMAYDPVSGTPLGLYLFGGNDGNGLKQDTWYLPVTGNWTQCSDTGVCMHKPLNRCCGGMAYDNRNHVLVLFGGSNCAGASCGTYFSDTWTFNASGWLCVAGTCSPP